MGSAAVMWPWQSDVAWRGAASRSRPTVAPPPFLKFSLATLIMSLMRLSWLTSEAPGS